MSWGRTIQKVAGAGVPAAVADPPRKAAAGGWTWLFTPTGLGVMAVLYVVWKIYDGSARAWLLGLQVRLLEFLPVLVITVVLLAAMAMAIGFGLWAFFHSRELGAHGFGMAWKGGVAAVGATVLLSMLAFAVTFTQHSTAALSDTYLGKAPAANVCQAVPAEAPAPRR